MAGGAVIDRRTTRAAGVLRHVRRHADAPHLSHKALGVVVLVGTDVSLPRFQRQCLESCFYTDPMKTNDHNECLVYATPLQR